MVILLTVGLIKKILLYKISYFPEQHTHSKNKIEVENDLGNYTTISYLQIFVKFICNIYTSDFAKKANVASLR